MNRVAPVTQTLGAFDPAFEFYCFKNCYRQWLEMQGVPNAFYYLDCTLDWRFSRKEDDALGYSFSTSDIYTSVLPSFRHKIVMTDDMTISPVEIWERNKMLLKAGIPFVAAVDVYYLPYTPYFGKKHSYHALLVCGMEEDQLDIIDWYPPWYYQGQLSYAVIDDARSSENPADGLLSGNPIRYLWAELERGGWQADSRELIAQAVGISIDRFYGTTTSERDRGDVQFGAKALAALKDAVVQHAAADEETRARFLQDLHGKTYFVPTRKNLFARYVERACEEFRYPKLAKAVPAMYATVTEWKRFLNLTVKASMAPTADNYATVVKTLDGLIFAEKDINYLLYDAAPTIWRQGESRL
ncbi:hypothetical protein PaecuDRAFT_1575 [Paenibacillus curdlanolyticus YK9]|uniref:Butirosin biosynthesis protein H N-terminal domain-containing protein n=1 Tax=Paenibacillus curdlanolyticus YK9 TaxID=717606 RepID=E0I7F1_9BACL|nr:BtrH N-terminal domain-containing protein [Paenibacillus curdlanolyticus]EFM11967.1 hypothetical protein PaecuDRAFT_1575 [Paenibacillus curdlanolyticus YK9]